MVKFGKIVCGTLIVPLLSPGYIVIDGKKVYNPTTEQLTAAGYLPIIETEPEEIEGKTAEAYYELSEDGTEIIQQWNYIDVPEPELEPANAEE